MIWTTMLMALSFTVSGYIADAGSGETLVGATLLENGSGKGTVTNEYGHYSLTLPAGAVHLSSGYVGYRHTETELVLTKDTVLNLFLEQISELSEVTITGNRMELGVQGSQMSAIDLNVQQIKAVPALMGETDVLKALQLLPGVQSATEGTAGMLVRGGNVDENLLLIDGVPLYNVNHMLGMFSAFNADAVKNVTLYKGSFPARYCGRLSSVVDVRLKDGDLYEYHGGASIGLVSAKINLEGPIVKGKTSFNISARRTYSDIITNTAIQIGRLKYSQQDNYGMGYYFYDLNLKLTHRIDDKNKLYASWYSGDDGLYFRYKAKDTYEKETDRLSWKWGNAVASVRWNSILGPKMFMDLSASYTQYRHRLGLEVESKDSRDKEYFNDQLTMKSGIFDETVRADFHWSPAPEHDVRFGSYLTHHTFRPDVTTMSVDYSDRDTSYTSGFELGQKQIGAMELQMYAEDNLSVTDLLKLDIGLSGSVFGVDGKTYATLEPRISGRLLLSDRMSVKAGYARMSQYIHLLSNNSLSMPTDLWVPATGKIAPEHSNQFAAGLFYELPSIADFSVEAYYKRENNLLEYVEGASYIAGSSDWQEKIAIGRGWSYGIELLAQRSVGRFNGWVSYTWSRARRQFDREGMVLNGGRPFDAKYDRRHNFSVTGSYKFSDRFDLAATWMISSGACGSLYTQYYDEHPVSSDYNISTSYYYNDKEYHLHRELGSFGNRNSFRLNPYHRLDLSLNWHRPSKRFKGATRTKSLSIYNAYNNMNPFLVYIYDGSYYDSDSGTKTNIKTLRQLTLLPIIPTFTYSLSF